jgi:membrane fusion protein, copper/silver efflux system
MKRFIFLAAAIFLLCAAFLAGYGYRTAGSSVVVSQPAAVDRQPEEVSFSDDDSSSISGAVRISPEKQRISGIRVATVARVSETHTLRILGRVAANETRLYQINAAVDGWVREIYKNTTGSLVEKDEPLVSFYSPEFLSAQQAFLYAVGRLKGYEAEGGETPGQIDLTKANIQQYTNTLLNLGMGEIQIGEIARTRQLTQNIVIRSPGPGFVIVRNVYPGQRFTKGTELYRIADLSRIWILADLFENEAQYLKPGRTVKVSLPQQKKVFQAMVSSVLPQFDPVTRTLKIRLEMDNPGYALRPDMFVDVEIPVAFPPAVTVPASAIIEAGLRKTVFVDRGSGIFESRQVETGWRLGNRVEIKSGLKPGEQIVVSGNFLVDSESKMELVAAGLYGTMAKDPVCGTDVAVRKAEKTGRASIYQGRIYYFSSLECKQQFDKSPNRYLEKQVKKTD